MFRNVEEATDYYIQEREKTKSPKLEAYFSGILHGLYLSKLLDPINTGESESLKFLKEATSSCKGCKHLESQNFGYKRDGYVCNIEEIIVFEGYKERCDKYERKDL